MKKIIPIITIFAIDLFFSISSLIGYTYLGKESSPIYIIYNLIIFILSIIILFSQLIKSEFKCSKNELILLSIPILLTFLYLSGVLFDVNNDLTTNRFIYSILWSLPSIIIGIYLAKLENYEVFDKWLEVVMIIFTLSTIGTSISSLGSGDRVSIGGATYQSASYISAFAFGINLYYIFFGNNHSRFRFTKTKLYKFISYIFLIAQIMGVFTSGGRGGMVLIIVYSIYILISSIRSKNRIKLIEKYILIILMSMLLFIILLPKLMSIDSFQSSINRVFSYITDSGIDMSKTSGRDIVYTDAIHLIKMSPILGYGFFGFYKVYGQYPHNLFLEVLLQGGLIYLFFVILFIFIMIKKLNVMLNIDYRLNIIIIIALYPLTLLMFSGTYTNNSIFWFFISFMIAYKPKIKKVSNLE